MTTKPYLASKTIVGVLSLLVTPLSNLYDYMLSLPIQTLPPAVQITTAVVGAILAIWGRKTARKTLKGIIR